MAWNAAATYGIKWLWVVMVVALLRALLPASLASPDAYGSLPLFSVSASLAKYLPFVQEYFAAVPGLYVFMLLVFAPVIEEAVFRMLPLTIVQGTRPELVRAVLIVVCGIVFGIAHGSPMNVFIQGVGGVLLGLLYLKNDNSQWSSYASCVVVHAAYNFTVLMVG